MAVWVPNVVWEDGTITGSKGKNFAWFTNPVMLGRMLGAIALYYKREGNPAWKEAGEGMIKRVAELAIEKEDYAYLPSAFLVPNAKVPRDAPMPMDIYSEEFGGRFVQSPSQFYRVTGWKPALEMARKFANYLRWHGQYFLLDGRWDNGSQKMIGGHFHGHALCLLNLLEYARVAGDREMMQFVARSYEWGRGMGSTLTGWFPENIKPDHKVEPCAFADMVALAVRLSRPGVGDYWDDADRWIRNIFDDYQPEDGIFAPGCCSGNGGRAIYWVWQNMIEHQDGPLKVNLLLNRASKWADIYSYIPYEGRVEVKIKQLLKTVLLRARSGWRPATPNWHVLLTANQPRPLGRGVMWIWAKPPRATDRDRVPHRRAHAARLALRGVL